MKALIPKLFTDKLLKIVATPFILKYGSNPNPGHTITLIMQTLNRYRWETRLQRGNNTRILSNSRDVDNLNT